MINILLGYFEGTRCQNFVSVYGPILSHASRTSFCAGRIRVDIVVIVTRTQRTYTDPQK